MSDYEVIELLEDTRSKAKELRDVLEGYELKIRDIEPASADSENLNVTTPDIAEYIYNAKIELDQAANAIDIILDTPLNKEGK